MSEIDFAGLGLTEAEIEAIKLDADGNDLLEEEDTETTEEEVSEEVEAETPAEVEEEAEEEAEEESAEEIAPKESADTTFAPVFEAKGVENYEQVLADLDKTYDNLTDALAKKYEAGEMDFSTYRREERSLTRDYESHKQDMNAANLKAEIAAEHSKQSTEQKWATEQSIFYSDNDIFKTDALMRGALAAQLDILYADADITGKSGLWYLREAGKMVNARFGAPAEKVTPAAEKLLAAAEDKQKKDAAKPLEAPKTLADVPSAQADNEDAGEFAFMDKLSGLDYEKAIAKMNAEQRSRFMAA